MALREKKIQIKITLCSFNAHWNARCYTCSNGIIHQKPLIIKSFILVIKILLETNFLSVPEKRKLKQVILYLIIIGRLSRHAGWHTEVQSVLTICIQPPGDPEKEVISIFIALALFDCGDLKQTARVEWETPERLMCSERTQNKTGSQREQRVKCMCGCTVPT